MKPAHWRDLGSLLARPDLRVIRDEDQARLRELWDGIATRERDLDDRLALGIVGGTGVGKSTLINAIAGASISRASDRRPTTDRVVVYRHRLTPLPEGIPRNDLAPEAVHELAAMERMVIYDFPDIDSTEADHAAILQRFLPRLDVLLVVVDQEKYADLCLFELLRAVPQASGNLHFLLNKVDRLVERYPSGWAGITEEILADFRGKLEAHGGIRCRREDLMAISARAALTRRVSSSPDRNGAPEGDFQAVLDLLSDYKAEKRRRAAKIANLDAEKSTLVDEARESGLDPGAAASCALVRKTTEQREGELENILKTIATGALGPVERRGLHAEAIEGAGQRLAFPSSWILPLLGGRTSAQHPSIGDLLSNMEGHYLPYQKSMNTAERELRSRVEKIAGAVGEPPAGKLDLRGLTVSFRKDLYRQVSRALGWSRLRARLLPLVVILLALWFVLHPVISLAIHQLAEGESVAWGDLAWRAGVALVMALSPLNILLFLGLILSIFFVVVLLDWRKIRRAVDGAIASYEEKVCAMTRTDRNSRWVHLLDPLRVWETERRELERIIGET